MTAHERTTELLDVYIKPAIDAIKENTDLIPEYDSITGFNVAVVNDANYDSLTGYKVEDVNSDSIKANTDTIVSSLNDIKTNTNRRVIKFSDSGSGNDTLTATDCTYFSIHNTGADSLTAGIGSITVPVAAGASMGEDFAEFDTVVIVAVGAYNWLAKG
ncbi:MAG: hypothetical protein US20_C0005G0012 [Candidatus Pacebacteria bacterium GW2011_GWF1_36_5]|nr:MAG: hypothetical protein US20_C0005G0012 [Candidatus Pacebacteria bacterium GW2011_GWF1_36_5]